MNTLTLAEEYYVTLDIDNQYGFEPVELGGLEVHWHEDHFEISEHFRWEQAELLLDAGTEAERRQIGAIGMRGITITLLVHEVNTMVAYAMDRNAASGVEWTSHELAHWAFNGFLYVAQQSGLTVIGVDESTLSLAFAPLR